MQSERLLRGWSGGEDIPPGAGSRAKDPACLALSRNGTGRTGRQSAKHSGESRGRTRQRRRGAKAPDRRGDATGGSGAPPPLPRAIGYSPRSSRGVVQLIPCFRALSSQWVVANEVSLCNGWCYADATTQGCELRICATRNSALHSGETPQKRGVSVSPARFARRTRTTRAVRGSSPLADSPAL